MRRIEANSGMPLALSPTPQPTERGSAGQKRVGYRAVRDIAGGLRLALWRSTTGWGMFALLGAGMLVAATLLAAAPIYARAMADLGLTFTIRDELEGRDTVRVEFRQQPLATEEGREFAATVERRIDERVGWFREGESRYIRVGWFPAYLPGDSDRAGAPLAELQSLTGFEGHVQLLEGRLPEPTGPGQPMEVVVSPTGLRALGVEVGEPFELRERFTNCAPEISEDPFPPPPPPCDVVATASFTERAVVVGVVEPNDESDPFWVIGGGRYFSPYPVRIEGSPRAVPMLTREETILGGFAARHPEYFVSRAWHVFADETVLTRANFERARDDITGLYRELEPYGVLAYSPLRDTLDAFGDRASYQQTPLTILLLQITGIALFYVALISAVIVERQAEEITLLRARGATVLQVCVVFGVQGAFLGLPALVLGPLVAGACTAALGLAPAFEPVSNGELIPVAILPESFALAALGVALSVLAMLVPVVVFAMRSQLSLRRMQARPAESFVQRYFLDVALGAGAILLIVELQQRDSVFEPSATGGVTSDPLLLASPALIIAAACAIVLRVQPILLRIAARVAAWLRAPVPTLSLWQLVRNPGHYTRLMLLLMMAIAVGTFAASYATTADASYEDRANYEAGAEYRAYSARGMGPSMTAAELEAEASALPGVERASAVVRTTAGIAVPGVSGRGLQVLGIDTRVAPEMLWYRDDFAGDSLPAVLRGARAPSAGGGIELPADAERIRVWIRPSQPMEGLIVRAGIRDATGRYQRIVIGEVAEGVGWQLLEGPIAQEFGPELVPPLQIVTLTWSEPPLRTTERSLAIDDLTVVTASGEEIMLEDFERRAPWTVLPDRSPTVDSFDWSPEAAHSGAAGGEFSFRAGSFSGPRGLYLNTSLTPLPAVVSRSFVDGTGIGPGNTTLLQVGTDSLVPILVVGVFDLLPTTRMADGPVVVVDRDALISWATIVNTFGEQDIQANEVWFDLVEGADTEALEEALRLQPFGFDQFISRAEELARVEENPLITAGGSGILAIAFVAVVGLVAAALLTQLFFAVARRRVELAVVHTLGMSRGQVLSMLGLEYGVVLVLGLTAGVVVGLIVSGEMLSFLEVTARGEPVEPPFELRTQWGLIALAMAVVVLTGAVALGAIGRVLRRSSEGVVLRTE